MSRLSLPSTAADRGGGDCTDLVSVGGSGDAYSINMVLEGRRANYSSLAAD